MPTIAEKIATFELICKKCEVIESDKKKLFDRYFKWATDPVIPKFIDILTAQLSKFKITEDIFNGASKPMAEYIQKQVRPLIILTPNDLTSLRIYTNITLDANSNFNTLSDINITDIAASCASFVKQYETDISNDRTKIKWEGNDRVVKLLNTYIDMPTARAITRYITGIETQFQPDQIRDFATKVDLARKPMELLFADTPEDMFTMYSSGPHSCMSVSGSAAWKFMEKINICPPSFYAYFPYTRGAYLQKNGKIVARCILFADVKTTNPENMGHPSFNKKEGATKWAYGYQYTSSTEIAQKFKTALAAAEIKPINSETKGNHFIPPEGFSFNIPGILDENTKGEYKIPFPFFDNMDYHGTGWSASFDTTTKEFTLIYKAKAGSITANNRTGYLQSSDYITRKCDFCGSKIKEKYSEWTPTNDGKLACGGTCLQKANYVLVHQANMAIIWSKPDPLFIKSDDYLLFATLTAAANNNYYPIMEDGVFPEEGNVIVSAIGRLVKATNGKVFRQRVTANYVFEDIVPIGTIHNQKVVYFDMDNEQLVA